MESFKWFVLFVVFVVQPASQPWIVLNPLASFKEQEEKASLKESTQTAGFTLEGANHFDRIYCLCTAINKILRQRREYRIVVFFKYW
uniref:Putative secreted peptide n=1 Tax=Anopheles braziliensis TaxID=58242 RepID=A0A2M3ZTH4_9DIPT